MPTLMDSLIVWGENGARKGERMKWRYGDLSPICMWSIEALGDEKVELAKMIFKIRSKT